MVWDGAVCGLEKFFGNPIESLCRIELEKVGEIALPESFLALLHGDSLEAVDDAVVRSLESALLDELLHGLHPEPDEVDGIGDAEGDANIDVVEDGLPY